MRFRLRPGFRRALIALIVLTALDGCNGTTNGVNWFPGYYVLGHGTTFTAKQKILDDPLVAPFTGVQFRYHWSQTELAKGDYTAGYAQLDADT